MSGFFESDVDSDNDSWSDEMECKHPFAEGEDHCPDCFITFDSVRIIPEHINTQEGAPIKNIIVNTNLLKAASSLNMDEHAKNILIKHIESSSLMMKNSKGSTNKLLITYCVYFLLQSDIVECSPTRMASICDKLITAQMLKDGPLFNMAIKVYTPNVYIKEFLFDRELKEDEPRTVPLRYPMSELCIKIIRFCDYLIHRRNIQHGYEDIVMPYYPDRVTIGEIYPILKYDIDHKPLDPQEKVCRIDTLNEKYLAGEDQPVHEEDILFDKPQRIAAAVMYNMITFDTNTVGDADLQGKIVRSETYEDVSPHVPYTVAELSAYFEMSDKTMKNLVDNFGIKVTSSKRPRKVKAAVDASSR